MERRVFRVDPQLLDLARAMRQTPAPAEQKLWQCLRNRRLNGFKFRRQHTIDRYVAAFFCPDCERIIELDGDSHFEPGAGERDDTRTKSLEAKGHHVIRFTNVDVFENLDGVLTAILEACETR